MFLVRLLSEPVPFAKPETPSMDGTGHGGPKMPQQCALLCLPALVNLPGALPCVCCLLSVQWCCEKCKNQKSLKTGELCLREEKGVDGEAGEVAEGRKADTEVSAADEEVTSGLGIFFQFKTGLKTQAGIFGSVIANFQPPPRDLW